MTYRDRLQLRAAFRMEDVTMYGIFTPKDAVGHPTIYVCLKVDFSNTINLRCIQHIPIAVMYAARLYPEKVAGMSNDIHDMIADIDLAVLFNLLLRMRGYFQICRSWKDESIIDVWHDRLNDVAKKWLAPIVDRETMRDGYGEGMYYFIRFGISPSIIYDGRDDDRHFLLELFTSSAIERVTWNGQPLAHMYYRNVHVQCIYEWSTQMTVEDARAAIKHPDYEVKKNVCMLNSHLFDNELYQDAIPFLDTSKKRMIERILQNIASKQL